MIKVGKLIRTRITFSKDVGACQIHTQNTIVPPISKIPRNYIWFWKEPNRNMRIAPNTEIIPTFANWNLHSQNNLH